MLKFEQVLHANLSGLDGAVKDWDATITKLATIEESAGDMKAKADKADWAGENAGVTRDFVRKTAKEFGDAKTEASSIRNILRDAHTEFAEAKKSLGTVVDEAPAKGIRIDPDGVVSYLIHPDRRPKDYDGPKPTQEQFEATRSAIKSAVDRANDADEIASRALRTLVGKDKNDFSGTDYNSLKAASKAQDAEDAKAAAAIVAKGDDATPAEIQRLNKFLTDNKGDQYFAEQFALDVGAKGNLEFWADMGDPSDGSRLGADHQDMLKELQKNWSLTLASATHSDSPAMNQWKTDIINAGDDPIRTRATSPYGFQVMSNLMRYGNFDSKFLHDYGDALVVTENKMTKNGMGKPSMFWTSSLGGMTHLNWSGTDIGRDPMEGFMESLGHNPKASADFFNSSIDLTPGDTTDDKKLDAFDYFTKDRDWPKDVVDGGESNKFGYDSLGHALESATLGHSYDDPNAALIRTDDGAKVMEKVVAQYGGDAELLKKQESLSDSLGNMGAGYIDDLDWGLDKNADDSVFAPGKNTGSHAEFGRADARGFLSSLGQHPDAYASVTDAQRIYTTSVLEAQVNPDGTITNEGLARHAVNIGAQTQGILDQSRADQIGAEYGKTAEDYSKAMEKKSGWIDLGVGAAVGAGAAFLPISAPAAGAAAVLVPLAVENGQGVIEQYAGQMMGDWSDASQDKYTDGLGDKAHQERAAVFKAGEENVEVPASVFIDRHNLNHVGNGNFAEDLRQSAQDGYNTGNLREVQQGNQSQTG
ncbi:hypothetical protein HY68_15490 [Streptomyces sp. AcH 505]|uniref:hypothetical protein n=1 Tax=unclassified Streptomyces TaxID=2593676 RepID=UPI00059205E2|nr:hypothetical protein [Streptomyces sp. NBC_00370]KIF69666.1 hypothetical protein HY68_15490 [Streptomyces sp. AcH 505]